MKADEAQTWVLIMCRLGKWHIHKDKSGVTTKNDQEHRQEKQRIAEVNPMHINQTLNIKSKPKTTNMELESPEALIRWVLIVDKKFLKTALWGEMKNQVKAGMLEEEPIFLSALLLQGYLPSPDSSFRLKRQFSGTSYPQSELTLSGLLVIRVPCSLSLVSIWYSKFGLCA